MYRPANPTAVRSAPCTGREDGSVLIWALFFVSLTTGILVAHSLEMSANRRTMDTRYRRVDLASTIAESGLTDATAYLRRQPVQPVLTFAPQLDMTSDPPINDTLDPSVGLVREFEVHGNLWGRYEVRNTEATDVSANYGEPAGSVWDVGARGYLYELVDRTRPFDQAPNRVISKQTVYTELRGLPLALPASSALFVQNTDQVSMLGNASLDGLGGPAIAYEKPTPLVLPVLDATIVGTPISISLVGLDLSFNSVFGVREDRLRNLADIVVLSPRQLRGRVIDDKIVYVPGDLVLDPATASLNGRMLLVVAGDLLAQPDNNSAFRGVVYTKGNIVLEGPFHFTGSMIGLGLVKFGGSADQVIVKSDPTAVTELQAALSQYRVSKDKRPAASSGAFASPTDIATTP